MHRNWIMTYDESVTTEERAAIEHLGTIFHDAFLGRRVRWQAVTDAHGRALVAGDVEEAGVQLAKFRLADLLAVEDVDDFQLQVLTGQFAAQS